MKDWKNSGSKRKLSLSLKLNLLIAAIVLVVSAVLVTISYNNHKKTVYEPVYTRMGKIDEAFETCNNDYLHNQIDIVSKLLTLDGYQAAYDRTAETGDDTYIKEWLSSWAVNADDGVFMPYEEYQNQYHAAEEEAQQKGLDSEAFYDWIVSGESGYRTDLLSFYNSGESALYALVYSINNMGLDADVTSVMTVMGDGQGGWRELYTMTNAKEQENGDALMIDFSVFGKPLDHVDEIDAFQQQKSQSAFLFDGEKQMLKVMSLENNGILYDMIFSYDTSVERSGQKSFLLRMLLYVGILVLASIAISLLLLRRMATKPLQKLAKAVDEFGAGTGEDGKKKVIELDIRSNDEIGELYRNFRGMQTNIIEYSDNLTRMTAEKERIATELELATRIQADMLPGTFPPFPDRREFDIYASMDPAKEVGGDFYDFFMIDEDHLALVIADVSGKGVPAALFMMISKIMVQNITKAGISPARVLELANGEILANNSEDMFVTVWLGILEISTGRLTAANAGHEYPFVKGADGSFACFKNPHGFVLGSLPGMKYRDYELQLVPGSKLFVYTDGVPEATDVNLRQFGSERLLEVLNECADSTPEEILRHVRASVDAFAGEAEQFDDLTMMCLEYRGPEPGPVRA